MKSETCSSCGSANVYKVLHLDQVPTHCNILWNDLEGATNCPVGDIQLNFCRNCGHLYNSLFDNNLMKYDMEYENTLDFSPSFQKYSKDLVSRLITTYDLCKKHIIEIGCGKGDFLKMICSQGENLGYGFDKSYDPSLEKSTSLNSVEFIQDFYSEKYSHYPADLIVSRHVLEHIEYPGPFISGIKNTVGIKSEKIYYFEVPNILYTLRDLGIWDLIYEHCSYFSPPSISNLFQNQNFGVLEVHENYGGQFLSIEATNYAERGGVYEPEFDINFVEDLVRKFSDSFDKKISYWKQKLDDLFARNKRVVVWGGGSKGVTFLNFLKTEGKIQFIVDINPRKEGKFVAGTGQKYIKPDELKKIQPDVVVVMNPIYKTEIMNSLNEMGLDVELLVG